MSICSTAAPDPRDGFALTVMGADGLKPLFVPMAAAFKLLGVKPTTGWRLVAEGKIKTVHVGARRNAVVESLEQLAREWMEAQPAGRRKGLAEATVQSLASRRRKRDMPAGTFK